MNFSININRENNEHKCSFYRIQNTIEELYPNYIKVFSCNKCNKHQYHFNTGFPVGHPDFVYENAIDAYKVALEFEKYKKQLKNFKETNISSSEYSPLEKRLDPNNAEDLIKIRELLMDSMKKLKRTIKGK